MKFLEMKRMNKLKRKTNQEEHYEKLLISSEESRILRLYINLHKTVFDTELDSEITMKEINAVFDMFGPELSEDEIVDKIIQGRIEFCLFQLEEDGLVTRTDKNGLVQYSMNEDVKRQMKKMKKLRWL